ncbi:MAG: 16S rRNA (cytosine(1402)-N(4))-methyltransferase [Bacteroidetes bacterium]|nr:MAG: 16S rRNA (cytosine(1402)-N(4))-methyltransferase [Bacteroidota bacterium]
MYHNPVLLKESIEGLQIREGGVYVDATYGGGGHSREILKNIGSGSLIAFDQDIDAIGNEISDERLTLIQQNFRYARNFLKLYKAVPVNGILADLGISSHQIDDGDRGFSVRFDAELDLRMNREKGMSAKEIVNSWPVREIRNIMFRYGDLKNAGKVAASIEGYRNGKEITTTTELKEAISKCAPRGLENKFFAKVFQALRIEVNDELGALKELLLQSVDLLDKGGRIVVISYHSLEDRLVKNFFKSGDFEGRQEKDFYGNLISSLRPVTKKPIVPTEEEIKNNSRARSAKLRIAEKI